MKKQKFATIQLIICALILCYSSHVAAEKRKITIGIASNFSEVAPNSYNPMGNPFKNGMLLALDQLSKLYPNLEIGLKEFDYGNNDANVLNVANAAVASAVLLVIGYEYSTHALLAAPIHHAEGLPMLTPSASADRIGNFGKYVHMGSFNNSFQAETLAHFAFHDKNLKRAAIVMANDCAYCQDLSQSFRKEFTKIGGSIIDIYAVLQDQTDFSETFKNFDAKNYDMVFVPNQEFTSGRIIKHLYDRGFTKIFMGGDGWRQLGGMMFEPQYQAHFQGYMTAHWHPDLQTEASLSFKRDYEQRFHSEPTDSAVLSYDSMLFVGNMLSNLDHFSRESIEEGLSNMKTYSGVIGKLIFSRNNAPQKTMLILKSQPKNFIIDRIVDPEISKL